MAGFTRQEVEGGIRVCYEGVECVMIYDNGHVRIQFYRDPELGLGPETHEFYIDKDVAGELIQQARRVTNWHEFYHLAKQVSLHVMAKR
ncbi:MAG: hypothetical protein ACK4SY_09635 [Pyrobaculum sp.]